MSTHLSGHLVSARSDNTLDEVLAGYHVTLFGASFKPQTVETKKDGEFNLSYGKDTSNVGFHRRLKVVVHDIAGREIPCIGTHDAQRPPNFTFDKSGHIHFEDVDDNEISVGFLIIRDTEAKGFLVTLGTGETPKTIAHGEVSPPGRATVPSGWGLSRGNAVKLLIDHEAFEHAAALFRDARTSILLSQYNFSLPPEFRSDATRETTKVIFDFHSPVPDAAHPRAAGVGDARPERLLLEAADLGVDVRMLFHAWKFPRLLKIVLGAFVFPFAGSDGVLALSGPLSFESAQDEARLYFGSAGRPNIKIRDFQMSFTGFAVMHARLTVVDELHAMCIGASFVQSYVDTHTHAIDAPVRGDSDSLPDHDVGVGITGPAVSDLHENLKLLWNVAAEGDRLPTIGRNPPPQAAGPDGICSIQVVRTLSEDRFDEAPSADDPRFNDPNFDPREGEKGVLEAYLRAIAMADTLIYLENQYFIDRRIANALVSLMKRKPQLQVIILLNICPDIWWFLYPRRQRRLITSIRRAIGETPDDPRRFGVFTRWSYEFGQPRPRMLPIYVHSKAAVVDDKWATVGSANLDSASMDRAVEVNVNLLSDADGEPANDVPDLLRRKLWAEHLGYFTAAGAPDPKAADLLKANIPVDGWLGLWKKRSAAFRQHLQNQPTLPMTTMARVLPWPSDNTTHKTPRDHLTALGIFGHNVVPLKSTRRFNFETGQFVPGSKARMDY